MSFGARPHPTLAASACFAVLALILTGPALLGRVSLGPESAIDADPLFGTAPPPQAPPFNDRSRALIELPRDLTVARGLRSGRIPKWNPLSAGGAPLWAESGGLFFPLRLIFYADPSPRGYEAFVASRLVAAALGAFLLARRRGLSPSASFAAGASFELCGASIAHLGFGNFSAFCLLPWVLLGAQAVADGRSRASRAAAGAALALGIAGHGGHPTTVALVFGAFVVAVVGHMTVAWRRPDRWLRIGGWGAAATMLGGALAAPSLLPQLELIAQGSSYKERGIGPFVRTISLYRNRGALPVALFAPGLLPVMVPATQRMFPFSLTVGVLALVISVAGMLRRRLDIPLAAVALAGIILALEPPGFGWLRTVPVLKEIIPEYAWPLVALPLTQAVGHGIEALCAELGPRLVRRGFLVVLAASLTLVLPPQLPPSLLIPDFRGLLVEAVVTLPGLLRLLLPATFAAAMLAAFFRLRRSRLQRSAVAVLIGALLLEQALLMLPVVWHAPSAVLASSPSTAVRFLQRALADGDARFVGVPFRVGHPLTPMLFSLPDLRGISASPIARYRAYLKTLSPASGDFTLQDVPVTASPLLDLAAVRYIVLPGIGGQPPDPSLPGDPEARLVHADDGVMIYESPNALARARIVRQLNPVGGAQQAQAELARFAAATLHARHTPLADVALIEPAADGSMPPPLDGRVVSGDEDVRILPQDDPDLLVVQASLRAPGLLVIADTYYPGWIARVDGQPVPIFPANLLFRAVFVPAGTHTVELRYEPRSFRWGVWLFAVALACTLLLAAPPVGQWSHRVRARA